MAYKVLCEWQVALLTGGVRLSGVRRAAWGRMLVQMPQLAGCVSDGTAGEALCSCSKTRLAGARGELNAWDEEMRNWTGGGRLDAEMGSARRAVGHLLLTTVRPRVDGTKMVFWPRCGRSNMQLSARIDLWESQRFK